MILSEEKIKQGLLHPDKDVRQVCWRWFDCRRRFNDASVIRNVIQANELHGRGRAFEFGGLPKISELDEESLAWVIKELSDSTEGDFRRRIARCFLSLNPQFLKSHWRSIEAIPIPQEMKEACELKIRLLDLDTDKLWERMVELCKDDMKLKNIGRPYREAQWHADEIATRPDLDVSRILAMLAEEPEEDAEGLTYYFQALATRVVGSAAIEPAIPHILDLLHLDNDLQNEAFLNAAENMGSESLLRAIQETYSVDDEWFVRLYLRSVPSVIKSPTAVEVGLTMLAREEDPELREQIGMDLAEQFSVRGVEAARQVYLEYPDSWELPYSLVPVCKLMEIAYPETDEWETTLRERERAPQARFTRKKPISNIEPIRELEGRVVPHQGHPVLAGRNDKCPCGSGKKFKKCCLNKITRK